MNKICLDHGCCDHIRGIDCSVQNCVHHADKNYCTAEEIQVGPNRATSSCDTACATFKPKTTK